MIDPIYIQFFFAVFAMVGVAVMGLDEAFRQ